MKMFVHLLMYLTNETIRTNNSSLSFLFFFKNYIFRCILSTFFGISVSCISRPVMWRRRHGGVQEEATSSMYSRKTIFPSKTGVMLFISGKRTLIVLQSYLKTFTINENVVSTNFINPFKIITITSLTQNKSLAWNFGITQFFNTNPH